MDWEYIKDKVLVFGEEDYVFIDMIMSIVKEFDNAVNKETTKIYTCLLIEELMRENLIDIFEVEENFLKRMYFTSDTEILTIISEIKKKISNDLDFSDIPFMCISTNQNGENYIKKNNANGW